MLLGNELNPKPLLGVVSRLQTYVSIASISCLSIEPHNVVFDRKEYWNPKWSAGKFNTGERTRALVRGGL
jgi:hypothetical protein